MNNTHNIKHHTKCKCTCEQDAKIDIHARDYLQSLYTSLDDAVNDANDLYLHWSDKNDKRAKKALQAEEHIFKAQGLLNDFAEGEDIDL